MRSRDQKGPESDWDDLRVWWLLLLVGPVLFAVRVSSPVGIVLGFAALVGAILAIQLTPHLARVDLSADDWLLLGFCAWLAISLLWSPAPFRGLRFVFSMFLMSIAYLFARTSDATGGASQLWWAGLAGLAMAVLALVFVPAPAVFDGLNPDRILGMAVITLVIAAWYGPRSRWYTLVVGLVALGTTVASGSRMASLVVAVLFVLAPRLRLPARVRALLAAGLVAVMALFSTSADFQERLFVGGEGDPTGLISLGNLNTSGRSEVWPVVADSCGFTFFGHGAGAADAFSSAANSGFPEPHNEYLRIWCDTGLAGSLALWGFFALAIWRVLEARKRTRQRRWVHHSALQMTGSLLAMALTDNPLTTILPFMLPLGLMLGWAVGEAVSSRRLGSDSTSPTI